MQQHYRETLRAAAEALLHLAHPSQHQTLDQFFRWVLLLLLYALCKHPMLVPCLQYTVPTLHNTCASTGEPLR